MFTFSFIPFLSNLTRRSWVEVLSDPGSSHSISSQESNEISPYSSVPVSRELYSVEKGTNKWKEKKAFLFLQVKVPHVVNLHTHSIPYILFFILYPPTIRKKQELLMRTTRLQGFRGFHTELAWQFGLFALRYSSSRWHDNFKSIHKSWKCFFQW